MEKNYLKIVIDGWMNPDTRNNLSQYFIRQFKEAEKEHHSLNEFFKDAIIA